MSLHVYDELVQGTSDWHDARRGMVTASVVGQLVSVGSPDGSAVECPTCKAPVTDPCISAARKTPTPIKGFHVERSAAASTLPPVYETADNETSRSLAALLVAERITGFTDPTFMSNDMFRGIEDEPRAREMYAKHYAPVTEVGFMTEDKWGFTIGLSPDGLVGEDGLIEVKSRRSKNHVLTVLSGEVPAANYMQLQCALLVSGRKWVDYISFASGMSLWRHRVYPDRVIHEAIVEAVRTFEQRAEQMVSDYLTKTEGLPVAERLDFEVVI